MQVSISKIDGNEITLSNGQSFSKLKFIQGEMILQALFAASEDKALSENARSFYKEIIAEIYDASRSEEWFEPVRRVTSYLCDEYHPIMMATKAEIGVNLKICLSNSVRAMALVGLVKEDDKFALKVPKELKLKTPKEERPVGWWKEGVINEVQQYELVRWEREKTFQLE